MNLKWIIITANYPPYIFNKYLIIRISSPVNSRLYNVNMSLLYTILSLSLYPIVLNMRFTKTNQPLTMEIRSYINSPNKNKKKNCEQ